MRGATDPHAGPATDEHGGLAADGHGRTRTLPIFVWVLLWLIVAAALALRLVGLRFGLPAVYNPDEVAIMSRALAFAKGDLNPHNFLYPTFYFYALFVWEGLTALVAVATRSVGSFGAFQREFFLDPTRVYVAGRVLTALCGTATVGATWALGRRIAGPWAGLAAALCVAISPLHVRDSHYVKHDVPVTLIIVLAYLAYQRLWTRADRGVDETPRDDTATDGRRPLADRALVAAAAITGIAFSTHYYAIFLAIPLAWTAARGARDARAAVTRIAIAALVSAGAFFLFSPFILAEPGVALRDIHANRQIVVDRAVGSLGYAATAVRYAQMLWLDTLGWPFVLLAIAGLIVSARDGLRRTVWLLAFPLPFLAFIAGTFPASRYLIPIVPFLAVFAGIAIARLARASALAAAVPLGLACLLPLGASLRTDLFIRQTDTRTLAAHFIETHMPAGATILTQPYSAPLTPTAASLAEAVARSGKEMPTKTRLEIARTPYPAPAYRLLYLGQGLDADKMYVPYASLGGPAGLDALRAEHVAFLVLKQYNGEDPAARAFRTAVAREGRRIAVFSPMRDATGAEDGARPEPFLHNTDARIDAALERPGPVVEIWRIDGSSS